MQRVSISLPPTRPPPDSLQSVTPTRFLGIFPGILCKYTIIYAAIVPLLAQLEAHYTHCTTFSVLSLNKITKRSLL